MSFRARKDFLVHRPVVGGLRRVEVRFGDGFIVLYNLPILVKSSSAC